MNYGSILKNDVVNGEGICVSLFVSGCPIQCPGCFNKQAWDYNYGQLFTEETMQEILEAISANGIQRNFSVLGGEPLSLSNLHKVAEIVQTVKNKFPDIKIFIWTGYEWYRLLARISEHNPNMLTIFKNAYAIISGPFIEEQKDLSLKWRGSSNQEIHYLT